MKRILFAMVLLSCFCFHVRAFADDVYADFKFSGPIVMAGEDAPITLAKISNACQEACQAESKSCKDMCTTNNITCQKECMHDEDCIYSCGKTYGGCIDGCDPEYRKCIKACLRYYDGGVN
jgi:hypothetical protein